MLAVALITMRTGNINTTFTRKIKQCAKYSFVLFWPAVVCLTMGQAANSLTINEILYANIKLSCICGFKTVNSYVRNSFLLLDSTKIN
jgi:hypothetical protein